TFSITFTEAAATVNTNTGLSVAEGGTATLTSAQLSATADVGDPASELVYTVTTEPPHVTLKRNGVATTTFTQDELNTGKVTYVHDGSDNNDSFQFSVADAPGTAATGTFSITFTEAAATVNTNTGLSVAEGGTATLTSAQLSTTADVGDPASELVYTV